MEACTQTHLLGGIQKDTSPTPLEGIVLWRVDALGEEVIAKRKHTLYWW
jgi:hypothetical protein